MSLPSDSTAPSIARNRVAELASTVSDEDLDNVRLLVSELVTNAVKHAGLGPGETVGLDVRARPRSVEVMLRYPEHRGCEPRVPLEPGEASHWGLFIVDRIADRWSVVLTQGVMEAWFELDCAPQAVA